MNPLTPGEISVTIKVPESKKYAGDAPWLVFRASDSSTMKTHLVETFGLNAEEAVGLTLFDVAINAQRIATKVGGTAVATGGTVINVTNSAESASAATPGSNPAYDPPAEAAAPEGPHPLLAEIEAQADIPALQNLWARNKATFDANADLMAAYKAKGKGLSA